MRGQPCQLHCLGSLVARGRSAARKWNPKKIRFARHHVEQALEDFYKLESFLRVMNNKVRDDAVEQANGVAIVEHGRNGYSLSAGVKGLICQKCMRGAAGFKEPCSG